MNKKIALGFIPLVALAIISTVWGQSSTISGLSSGSPLQSTDAMVVARSGANFKVTGADVATFAASTRSINDAPARSLVTTTASTGYQISSTRPSQACYEGSFSTTSTIGGPASASIFLETADTNSTTPSDWTTKGSQTYSNTITVAVALNQVQGNNWTLCRNIPAGKFVRIRSGSITGTASASINSGQQETLY